MMTVTTEMVNEMLNVAVEGSPTTWVDGLEKFRAAVKQRDLSIGCAIRQRRLRVFLVPEQMLFGAMMFAAGHYPRLLLPQVADLPRDCAVLSIGHDSVNYQFRVVVASEQFFRVPEGKAAETTLANTSECQVYRVGSPGQQEIIDKLQSEVSTLQEENERLTSLVEEARSCRDSALEDSRQTVQSEMAELRAELAAFKLKETLMSKPETGNDAAIFSGSCADWTLSVACGDRSQDEEPTKMKQMVVTEQIRTMNDSSSPPLSPGDRCVCRNSAGAERFMQEGRQYVVTGCSFQHGWFVGLEGVPNGVCWDADRFLKLSSVAVAERERRLRFYSIGQRWLVHFLRYGAGRSESLAVPSFDDVPAVFDVVDIRYSFERCSFLVMLASPEFPPVDEGCEIPVCVLKGLKVVCPGRELKNNGESAERSETSALEPDAAVGGGAGSAGGTGVELQERVPSGDRPDDSGGGPAGTGGF